MNRPLPPSKSNGPFGIASFIPSAMAPSLLRASLHWSFILPTSFSLHGESLKSLFIYRFPFYLFLFLRICRLKRLNCSIWRASHGLEKCPAVLQPGASLWSLYLLQAAAGFWGVTASGSVPLPGLAGGRLIHQEACRVW